MEPSSLKNPFCSSGMFIHWRAFHSEIKINNNNSTDMTIQSHLSSVKNSKWMNSPQSQKGYFSNGGSMIISTSVYDYW